MSDDGLEIGALSSRTPAERSELAAQAASRLGAHWAAGRVVEGDISLPLVHMPSGQSYVIVPGGTFDMGLSEKDVEEASEFIAGFGRW